MNKSILNKQQTYNKEQLIEKSVFRLPPARRSPLGEVGSSACRLPGVAPWAKTGLLSSVFCLLSFAGCAENKYAKPIEQLCPPAANKTAAMATAEQVLAGMHFGIEKFDVDAGYIRTAPLSGAQSFELWRSDSVGSFNRSEADLHSIRRAVEINISEQAGQLCINCKATTQRLSLPQSQSTAGQSRPVMSPDQKSVQKFKLGHEQKSNLTWTDLGRDSQLETEILKRIEKQLAATKKESNK